MTTKIKLLDCTLRDGGFYNNWNFDIQCAKETIRSLDNSGVDIVELGYKSLSREGFAGVFKFCNEDYLEFIRELNVSTQLAFMLDLKEFREPLQNNQSKVLEHLIQSKGGDSLFTWVRIATSYKNIDLLNEAVTISRDNNLKVCVNLMAASLLANDEFTRAIDLIAQTEPDVLYLADSFGSFYPEDVVEYFNSIKKSYSGTLGFHSHDNQGLAYLNSLTAIEAGVEYIDGTLYGMGRGAGNLKLEQLMFGLCKKKKLDKSYDPSRLLNCIENYYKPLHQKFQWGFSIPYMLSGLENIHQTYVQELSDLNQYSYYQIQEIVSNIPEESKKSFSRNTLDKAISQHLNRKNREESQKKVLTNFKGAQYQDVILIANGPRALAHKEMLTIFLKKHPMKVVFCNQQAAYENLFEDYDTIILNEVRLKSFVNNPPSHCSTLISGFKEIDYRVDVKNIYHFPYEIGDFSYRQDSVTIPKYEAGFYALAILAACNAQRIFLFGFDGYDHQDKNELMNQAIKKCETNGLKITSLTPTQYSVNTVSLYANE